MKLECLKHKGFVSDRQRLFSELPSTYQDISPLTRKDVDTLQAARAKAVDSNPDLFTPKGKRKRTDDKENHPPKVNSFFFTDVPKKLTLNVNDIYVLTRKYMYMYQLFILMNLQIRS